jgi:hypothetical protein
MYTATRMQGDHLFYKAQLCCNEIEFTKQRLDSGDPRYSEAWLKALERVERLLSLNDADERWGIQLGAAFRYADVVATNLALNAAIAIRDAGVVPAFDTDPLPKDSIIPGGLDPIVSVSVRRWDGCLTSLTVSDWSVPYLTHSQVDLALLGELSTDRLTQMAAWAPIVVAAPNANHQVLRAAGAHITVDPVTLDAVITWPGSVITIGRLQKHVLTDHQTISDAVCDLFGAPVDVTVTTASYFAGCLIFMVNGEIVGTATHSTWLEADNFLTRLWGTHAWHEKDCTVLQIVGR